MIRTTAKLKLDSHFNLHRKMGENELDLFDDQSDQLVLLSRFSFTRLAIREELDVVDVESDDCQEARLERQ